MKKIRKMIALVLVATLLGCIMGGLSNAGAATFFGLTIGEEESDLLLGITYVNNSNGVQCIYTPTSTLATEPGEVVVTSDEPLAFDHVFDHWQDQYENDYYAGDKIYVSSKIELEAVWVEKDDGEGHIMHVVTTALQGLSKIFGLLFDVYEFYENFSISYAESKAAEEAAAAEAAAAEAADEVVLPGA